ncbi:MAG: phosphate ABC transporter permease PstA [Bacilli bacterium]
MRQSSHMPVESNIKGRLVKNQLFKAVFLVGTLIALIMLVVLLGRVFTQGISYLDWDFLTNFASRIPENAGIKAAIAGTLWIMAIVIPVSTILGVGTAIYLEEYAPKNWFTSFIQVNIKNLAGVPAIVFGLLGLTIFVRAFGFERSILAGGLTMSLLILPVIVVSTQEAIRSVEGRLREASFGLGATKWQTIVRVVLPSALPGILTGSILAFSRAIGEASPLLLVGAAAFIPFTPTSIMDSFTVLPIQIFNWTGRPQAEFQIAAAAGIIVLLVILIVLNSVAIYIRNKYSNRK